MLVLVSKSPLSLREWHHHPNIGLLLSPRSWWQPIMTDMMWAADNDAFNVFHRGRYEAMLDKIAGLPRCLFVTAPDTVGDAKDTDRRFRLWEPRIRGRSGQPVAYVAQDGARIGTVPWADCDAVFIGGTTRWKLSDESQELCREAKDRGKWLHMGRVNTRRRVKLAKAWGCDSIDGTQVARWTDTHLPWMLDHAAQPPQLVMDGIVRPE